MTAQNLNRSKTGASGENIIVAQNVQKHYGSFHALKG